MRHLAPARERGKRRPQAAWRARLPGLVAASIVLAATALWTYWGIAELYYEGWGLPLPQPLYYLLPGLLCLSFSLVALRWPRLGGGLLVVAATAFTAWWWALAWRRAGKLSLVGLLTMVPVSAALILAGVLFLLEGRRRREERKRGIARGYGWRHQRALRLVVAVPLLIVVLVSARELPPLLARYDDGGRGERRITAPRVDLVWAPEGPGWNWRQPWGGYPSWNALALYGRSPVGLDGKSELAAREEDMAASGLCRYLSADGRALTRVPAGIWRMPTVSELVASLTRRGTNADCRWAGEIGQAVCRLRPDKETPLWNPKAPPIYYWAAEERNAAEAYYVSYRGYVGSQPKRFGNPRHGYRCVREPSRLEK